MGSLAGGALGIVSPVGVVVCATAAVDMLRAAIRAKVLISCLHNAGRSVRGM
jgi:hypothetical protein